MSARTRTIATCHTAAVNDLRAWPDEIDTFRRAWWHCRKWGLRMNAGLSPMDAGQAYAARANAMAHYYEPCCNADLSLSKRLRSDTFAAIEASAAEFRSNKGKRQSNAAIRALILERDGGDCWLCGDELGDDATIEHKQSKSRGGTWAFANLALAHAACNRLMGNAGSNVKLAARHLASLTPERRAELEKPL